MLHPTHGNQKQDFEKHLLINIHIKIIDNIQEQVIQMCTKRCMNKDYVCRCGILFTHEEGTTCRVLYIQCICTLRMLHYKICHEIEMCYVASLLCSV